MIAGTRAAAVAADDKENPAVLAAADALREQVYRRVLSSDVLSSVKAHLRAKLYAELKGGNGSGIISASGDGGLAWQAHALPPARSPTLHQHILNCLVCEYLLIQQHKYTLSVFLSETGSGALPQLSQADILRLVGVLPDSKVHALLTGGGSGGVGSVLSSGAEGGAASAAGAPPRSRCLAESMVEALGSLGSRVSTHNAACQTSTAEASCGGVGAAGGGGSVSSQQLAQRLQAIEAEYCRKSSQLEAAAAQSLEDRMAAYQRDCDARCAAQLQERLAAIREAELAAVREQEAGRHAQLLEAERRGLQQEHQQRLAKLRAQEEEVMERSRRQHREQDLLREEHLRCMRADEERLHAWRAESKAKLAAAQAAARQQLEQAALAEQRAERQRQEGEEHLQARLADMQQRAEKVARQQAAAEAGLAQVEQLQFRLADTLQEQGSLRQQLAAAHAAHRGEQAELRQERDQLAAAAKAAAATAAAAGPGLSLQDSARLQAAVRRLMEQVEGLQGEAEACRQRERLWRSSAAEAEKLLGKSAKAQDRALQHGEELRLALAAAVREVADLQEQAALAAAGVDGPLAAPLQAASRDAQRWRDGAEARISAAMQEEERLRREAVQLSQRALANRTAAAQGLQQLLASFVHGRQQAAEPDADSPAERSMVAPQEAATTVVDPSGSRQQAVQHEQQHWRVRLPLPQQQQTATQAHAQQQWWQQQEAAHAALVQAAVAGTGSAMQQPGSAAAGAAAKPPSRTASDILAAYRARQQQSSGSGIGGAAAGMAVSPSWGTSLSQEASSEPEGMPAADIAVAAAAAADECKDRGPAPEQQAASEAAAEAPVAAATDSYYVSDFTSDDSGRF